MKTQGTAGTGAKAPDKVSGLAYKIGAAVVVAGAIIVMTSGLLGGVIFASLMRLLSLLGAPEDRHFLPPSEPQAGPEILAVLGTWVVLCGAWMFCLRLVIELLGLAARPALTGWLGTWGKLSLGMVAVGSLIQISAELPRAVLFDFIRYAEFGPFEAISTAGSLIVLCGLLIPTLFGVGLLMVFLGWTGTVGWGKLGLGWINQLGLGLVALAIIVGLVFGWSDPVTIIAAAGIGIILVGIVPHLLDDRRP